MPIAEPLRPCPHRRSLLYVTRDGSTWCFCEVRADPAKQYLDDRMATALAQWRALGRTKEGHGG